MNLTEACKLAKNIESFKTDLLMLLYKRDYTSITTEFHNKTKVDVDAEDEEITVEVNKDYDLTVEQIISLVAILMEKKAILSKAIENAKHNILINVNGQELSYDSAVEFNASLRKSVLPALSRLNSIKEGVSKTNDYGYKFDVEGKQTRYIYEKEVTVKRTFDINETKQINKKYKNLADEVSTAIDEAKISTKITVDIGIGVNDTMEDIIDTFVSKK